MIQIQAYSAGAYKTVKVFMMASKEEGFQGDGIGSKLSSRWMWLPTKVCIVWTRDGKVYWCVCVCVRQLPNP